MSIGVERAAHASRCARVAASLREAAADAAARPLGLAKRTSNLFRDRAEGRKTRLDLGDFDHVLEVDAAAQWVDVEGSTTYEALVDATLPHGVMPAVVPQLKTITVGGAVAGVGIEATSFREGLVHHTVLELEVLLADGRIVVCTPENAHRDLFHGFANSYGTLGYALRVKLRTRPARACVRVEHRRFESAVAFFVALAQACSDDRFDFVDGVVFDATTLVLDTAAFVEAAPRLSDYRGRHIYYRSLLTKEVDWLSGADWLWRWDTDWFWCSRNFGAQNPIVRALFGRGRLNSRTYTRLMRLNARWGVTRRWAALRGRHVESVIQDVDVPLAAAPAFLGFLLREIGIVPIWICPMRAPGAGDPHPLFPLAPRTLYVNFGFWDVVETAAAHEPGHFNRLIEHEVVRLGGIKSLYSDSYFSRAEFAAAYRMPEYEALKRRYDPRHRLGDLYEKCVLRA